MSLKKCLKSKAGWSFIEYAVIFVAITAATVIFIKELMNKEGRISRALRYKTDTYIAKTLGASVPSLPPEVSSGECPQAGGYQMTINNLQVQITAFSQQREKILAKIKKIRRKIKELKRKERRADEICDACSDCDFLGFDACEIEDALEDAIDALEKAESDLLATYKDLGRKIQELEDFKRQTQEDLAEQCPGYTFSK
ncbi:MAG: hypothetical protein NC936_03170 [Candidatus Omnitrophica bacterium]|nr:hypothetical protein [Candidatus Omnitrophota bacterium]